MKTKLMIFTLIFWFGTNCFGSDFLILKDTDTSATYLKKDKILYFRKVEMQGGGIKIMIYTPNQTFEFYNEEIYKILVNELVNPKPEHIPYIGPNCPKFAPTVEKTEDDSKLGPAQTKVLIQDMIKEVSSWTTTTGPWESSQNLLNDRKKYLIENLQKLQ